MVYHHHVESPNGRRSRRRLWLLLLPATVPLLTPLYTRTEPRLGGMPFFFWAQLAFVPLAVAVMALVYVLTRRP
jgi:hypothetical protein